MGVSVSTGLTYLQQPGLKQLLTCVRQMPGALINTHTHTQAFHILSSNTHSSITAVVFYYYSSRKNRTR